MTDTISFFFLIQPFITINFPLSPSLVAFHKFLFVCLFILGCFGSLLLCVGFLQLRRAGSTLHCGARASYRGGFSCCGAWGLGARASVDAARELSSCGSWTLELRLISCGAWAQLLCVMGALPGPGLEPMSPALAGRFLTTAPPGKSPHKFLYVMLLYLFTSNYFLIYHMISPLTYPKFNFHIFMSFSDFLLLMISNFIPFSLENKLCISSIHRNLLRLVLILRHGLSQRMFYVYFRTHVLLLSEMLYRCPLVQLSL